MVLNDLHDTQHGDLPPLWGPWTISISVTWELAVSTEFQAPPETCRIRVNFHAESEWIFMIPRQYTFSWFHSHLILWEVFTKFWRWVLVYISVYIITIYVAFPEHDALWKRKKLWSFMDDWFLAIVKSQSEYLNHFPSTWSFSKLKPFFGKHCFPFHICVHMNSIFVGNLSHMFLIHLHLTLEKVVLQQQLPVQKNLSLWVNPS